MKTQYKEGDVVLLNQSPFGHSDPTWNETTKVTLGPEKGGEFSGCEIETYPGAGLIILHEWISGYAPSHVPDTPEVISYFKSKSGRLLIKTAGENEKEIELDTQMEGISFSFTLSLGPEYYLDEGYTPIPRSEFDEAYKTIVEKLNKFASL